MRLPILTAAALLAVTTACSSGKLSKSTAEKLIKPDYPAMAPVRVPKTATVAKDSPRFPKLAGYHAALRKEGWVEIDEKDEGAKVSYTYRLTSKAPASTKTLPAAYHLPAADVEFVKVTRVESGEKTGRAAFEVRLTKPTGLFPLFQTIHPGAMAGQTKVRVADFDKQDGRWGLLKTDESFLLKE